MTLCLSCEELEDLTGKSRASAQARALQALGIAHRRRADGSVVVLRIHAETIPGGPPAPSATLPAEPRLDLDGL